MPSALDITKYYLAKDDESDEPLSHLKLQKLLYYAQGFHLALTSEPLFSDEIFAWVHGPVVRSVWDIYKSYGASGITPPTEVPNLPAEMTEILDDIWRVFGQFSAWRLRELTHETPPWSTTKQNAVISQASMREYFKTQLTGA